MFISIETFQYQPSIRSYLVHLVERQDEKRFGVTRIMFVRCESENMETCINVNGKSMHQRFATETSMLKKNIHQYLHSLKERILLKYADSFISSGIKS